MKPSGIKYLKGEICTECELKVHRQRLLDHPGWKHVQLGDHSNIMVFSSWGTILQYCWDRVAPYDEADICRRCNG